MEDEVLERNKNLNRGFRKLEVWREAVDLSAFEKKFLDSVKHISFKIKDQVLDSVFSISSNVAEGYCRKSIKRNGGHPFEVSLFSINRIRDSQTTIL
jgi:hypothetical protein